VLLDRYGANALGVAMKEALSKNMPHPNAVRKSLEMQRNLIGAGLKNATARP
jgi:hypothetical protein